MVLVGIAVGENTLSICNIKILIGNTFLQMILFPTCDISQIKCNTGFYMCSTHSPEPNFVYSYRLSLRVFSDPSDPSSMWKKNVKDIDGEILCVSQFTLLANTTKGNKPDFHRAMVGSESIFIFIYKERI